MWVVYLILIVLGLALIAGVYFYTRSHPQDAARGERVVSNFPDAGVADVPPRPRPRARIREEPSRASSRTQPAASESRILSLHLRLPDSGLPAATVLDLLRELGFVPGEHQIFHRFDEDGSLLYSVADLFEPGVLHPLGEEARLRGLSFFFESRTGAAAIARLDRMLGAVYECAERLGGHIEDREHHPLTAARELELKLTAAG
ncbi:MAG TPA: cell division protein ZipA C-terminal FtsZ-binding domain-containing protein, partial [Gammaproteobacteria bacterium]|nr:cell division protein ZipA C-terminal FtsZ-binding domain-containing protein [Gammaproteobacteria bacterium]